MSQKLVMLDQSRQHQQQQKVKISSTLLANTLPPVVAHSPLACIFLCDPSGHSVTQSLGRLTCKDDTINKVLMRSRQARCWRQPLSSYNTNLQTAQLSNEQSSSIWHHHKIQLQIQCFTLILQGPSECCCCCFQAAGMQMFLPVIAHIKCLQHSTKYNHPRRIYMPTIIHQLFRDYFASHD